MDGTSDHPVNTTDVHCITSPTHVHTGYQDRRKYSHNIANSPNLTNIQHLRALTDKLAEENKIAATTPQGRACIKNLQSNITQILNPAATNDEEQRVRLAEQERQQRVIDEAPIATIKRITDAPPSCNHGTPQQNATSRTLREHIDNKHAIILQVQSR